MNTLKTAVLLAALTGLLVFIGQMIGGTSGAILFLVLAGVMNFAAYWWSDKFALRMAGARQVTEAEEPQLHAMVREVAELSHMPMPKVFVVDSESPNAFATGRNADHAVVCVTTGLLRRLEPDELEGVLAHELSHVAHRDVAVMTVASFLGVIAGLVVRDVSAGVIFSWGQSDIDDPQSELHERWDVGIHATDGYFSIDTGKLTCAPLFASGLVELLR